ncbi:MAG TPA: hypothetical protein VNF05_10885 [Acidimicrobiales bacterium]|nr:hypothetical protein [Acidimicrobiales bacterium]
MLRRVFRVAAAAALGRAWAQKSPKWLSVALGIVLFRFIDARSSKSSKRAKREKP